MAPQKSLSSQQYMMAPGANINKNAAPGFNLVKNFQAIHERGASRGNSKGSSRQLSNQMMSNSINMRGSGTYTNIQRTVNDAM